MTRPSGIGVTARIAGFLIGLLGYAALATAQQSTGNIAGRVVDEQGAGIAGAAVSARQPATGFVREVVTDGNGLYLLDKEDRPLIGIQSLDTRAARLAALMAMEAGEGLHAICLQKPWPSQTPTLLAWVKANRPEIYERAGTAMLCKP